MVAKMKMKKMKKMMMMISAMLLLYLSFNDHYVSCDIRSSNRFIRMSFLLLKTNNLNNNNNITGDNSNITSDDNSNINDCVNGVCTLKPIETINISLQDQVISDWREAIVTSENTDVDNNNVHNDSNSNSSIILLKNDTAIGLDIIADPGASNLTSSTSVPSSSESAPSSSDSLPSSSVSSESLPSSSVSSESLPIQVDKSNVDELIKLGWSIRDAERALIASDNDIMSAASLLESEEEEAEVLRGKLKELVLLGNWDEKAAASSLIQCEGNITAANQLLIDEEITILNNFDIAVKDMIDSGWEEIVARQALLAQWNIDQRKAMGGTVNVSTEVLQSLKPTLHKVNETKSSVGASNGSKSSKSSSRSSSSSSSTTTKNKSSPSSSTNSASSPAAVPKPAKKEDVVFDVTATNFQKIVLESPIPVLLDIYADWCGPCKQLTPMLEQAAIKSGGMFRLVKLNSDKERSITELLSVTGLPTVFAIDKGKFLDRFVGMLPTDQLQNFLVRLVTGFGDRVQKDDITVAMLDEYTSSITNMIGLSSISFKKKEKLYKLVDEVMNMDDAYQSNSSSQDDVDTLSSSLSPSSGSASSLSTSSTTSSKSNSLSEGVKTALLYINNCRKDIRNIKYRSINTTGKAFQLKIANNKAAMKLLTIAGFQSKKKSNATATPSSSPITTSSTDSTLSSSSIASSSSSHNNSDDTAILELVHYNPAILTLITQRVDASVSERKFSKMKNIQSTTPGRHTTTTPSPTPSSTPSSLSPTTTSSSLSPTTTSSSLSTTTIPTSLSPTATPSPSSPSPTISPSFAPFSKSLRKINRKSKSKSNRKDKHKQRRGGGRRRRNYSHGDTSSASDDNYDDDDDASRKSQAVVKDDTGDEKNDNDTDTDTCDDDSELITVVFRHDASPQSKQSTTQSSIQIMKLSSKITLQKALEMLCTCLNTTVDVIQELEIKYPLPRKLIPLSTTNITHSASQELQRSIGSIVTSNSSNSSSNISNSTTRLINISYRNKEIYHTTPTTNANHNTNSSILSTIKTKTVTSKTDTTTTTTSIKKQHISNHQQEQDQDQEQQQQQNMNKNKRPLSSLQQKLKSKPDISTSTVSSIEKRKYSRVAPSSSSTVPSTTLKEKATAARVKRQARKGVHTLLSTGILNSEDGKKNNEYFGGDSTVVSAGDDSDDDDNDDDIDDNNDDDDEAGKAKEQKGVSGKKG